MKLQSLTQLFRKDSLLKSLLQTNYFFFYFTSLSLSNLSMNFFILHLYGDSFVGLRFVCQSLPLGNSFFPHLSASDSLVNISKNLHLSSFVSQMGCKDTDFFLSSKFFWHFFWKNLHFFISIYAISLNISNLALKETDNSLTFNHLDRILRAPQKGKTALKLCITTY